MKKLLTTYSGLKLDPGNIKPEDINIYDIAAGLSAMPRFAGQTRHVFTVASHSIILSTLVPKEYALVALLHDSSEAYIADLPSMVKALLPDYQRLEASIMDSVASAFKITKDQLEYIKSYDKQVAEIERQVLFGLVLERDYTPVMRQIANELMLTRRTIMMNFIDKYTQLV